MYWYNAQNGEIYLTNEHLPQKRGNLYLVIGRDRLFFKSFSLNTKRRLKNNDILNIQGHFIPFGKKEYLNIIYGTEKNTEKRFLSWIGQPTNEKGIDSYFYDEIPETLLFMGNPEKTNEYDFFIFPRRQGYEVIYLNAENHDFYSVFTKELSGINDKLLGLMRKFPQNREARILTAVEIPGIQSLKRTRDFQLDYLNHNKEHYFFLPDYFPLKKKFSNAALNQRLMSIKNILGRWNRSMNIFILLLVFVLFVNIVAYFYLKNDHSELKEKFDNVSRLVGETENLEFQLGKIKTHLQRYPDHLLFLKTICFSLDPTSTLLTYTMEDKKIVIDGFSADSLQLLEQLRKSGRFKEVKFNSTVTKNVYSQKEKFQIEIELETNADSKAPKTEK